ncbi:S-adenosyl-L-methionine-dependent methyltransferase [Cadophora sp. MPI-SDFR-AT-0126]|nr:S-adenosyl-L-methionine-dependent methyltransferase [Leotiomycetes sp. MPI-SDFR-AT-0126]
MDHESNEAFQPSSTTAPRSGDPSNGAKTGGHGDDKVLGDTSDKSYSLTSSTSPAAAPTSTAVQENDESNEAPAGPSNIVEYVSHPDIEVDDDQIDHGSDTDSALGSMPASSTVSLRSSVYEYIEENGRTYHAFNAGKYIGPNDEIEQERLDLQHHLFVMTMDSKLHLAPIENPQHVLDIATGTGIWAIEFAQLYPSCTVLGTDLSPIQPSFVPPNCQFRIDDAEEEWIFSQPFDYIHGRALVSCFRDPPSVITSIFANLTPGGYFEFQDPIMPLKSIDGSLTGTSLDLFQKSCMEAAEKLGRPWTNGKNYGSYYWATNGWVRRRQQKLQALWLNENLKEGLPAWGLSTLSRGLGWSRERIEVLIAAARKDLSNPNIHACAECYVAYGRKPHSP